MISVEIHSSVTVVTGYVHSVVHPTEPHICTPISIGNREWRLRLLHDTFSHYKYGGALPSFLESNPPFDEGTAGISVSAVSVGWWTTPGCYSVPSSRSYSPGSDVTVHSRLLEIENRKNEFYKSNIRSYNINLLYFIKWYFESN